MNHETIEYFALFFGKDMILCKKTERTVSMYKIEFGKSGMQVPTVAVGCMRISNMNEKEVS